MNRNLLVLSLFLVVLGVGSGFYLISFLGIVLLIPALLAGSRRPARPPSAQTPATPARQILRRPNPPKLQGAQASTGVSQPQPKKQEDLPTYITPTSPQVTTFSPPLFPNTILPSLSTMGTIQPATQPAPQKSSERDELVEAGALLIFLRLFLG